MQIVAVILAGGRGERFWPQSRKQNPKQFLPFMNDKKTLIQHTVERLSPLISIDNILVVTNKEYQHLTHAQLPHLPKENILLEPISKDTAPCIGLAAIHIQRKYTDSLMVVLPSDHLIQDIPSFIDTLKTAFQVAREDTNLVTIGITPSYPETGYGYIHLSAPMHRDNLVYAVSEFVEKPNITKAKAYISSGQYLWNSGIFLWKTSTILKYFETLLPQIYASLMVIYHSLGTESEQDILSQEFMKLPSISIDYGIMEHTSHIYTVPGTFDWNDMGSWLSLEHLYLPDNDGNTLLGNVLPIDTKNSIIHSQNKLIATLGVEDLIVIDTDDALLICTRSTTQDIKKLLKSLKSCDKDVYL